MAIPYKKVLRCDRKEENGIVQNNKPIKMWTLLKSFLSFDKISVHF